MKTQIKLSVEKEKSPLEEINLAAADLGSQTFRLVIFNISDSNIKIIKTLRRNVRLGKGVFYSREISQEAFNKGILTLKEFSDIIKEQKVKKVKAIATQTLRIANNAKDFLIKSKELGIDIEIISGEEEALTSLEAVSMSIDTQDKPFLVVDVGGGSTELTIAQKKHDNKTEIISCRSLELGAVTLTENFILNDPPKKEQINELEKFIDRLIKPNILKFANKIKYLIGTGGTATTLAAIFHKMNKYDPKIVRGTSLTYKWLQDIIKDFIKKDNKQRQKIAGLEPKRADIILAGSIIINKIQKIMNNKPIIVSDAGVLLGIILKMIKEEIGYVKPAHTRGLYV